MTLFWIICAVLLLAAIPFFAVPLWRGISRNNSVVRDAANLEILRDQIAEMDADLKNGLLTPQLHEQGKRELQARLLEEVGDSGGVEIPGKPHPLKITAIVLAVLLPLTSVGLYLKVGNPDAMRPQAAHANLSIAHDAVGLKALEENVAQNPNDPEALVILARSYSDLGRHVDAAKIYESLTRIIADEPILWADYAEALAMTHGSLRGMPTKLLERALELNPNHAKALALSGTAAMEREDFASAVIQWEKLLKLIPAQDSANIKMVKEGIREARQQLAQSKGGKRALEEINKSTSRVQAPGAERITGTVALNAALKSQAAPEDALFVLVRAAQGPKMPLAVIRKQVKDLPLQFTLDDSMAMSPEMKMSSFDQVIVVARISKSGDAISRPGDLQGMSKPIALGSSGIRIEIDQPVR